MKLTSSIKRIGSAALTAWLLLFPGTSFGQAGPTIEQIIDATGDATNALTGAADIVVDSQGNAYLTATGTKNVFKVTPSGTVSEVFATGTTNYPNRMAIDLADNVYFSIQYGEAIYRRSSDGVVTQLLDDQDIPNLDDVVMHGMDVGPDGSLYAAMYVENNANGNQFDGMVLRIANPGTCSLGGGDCALTQIIDISGDGTNNFRIAVDVAVDPAGNVYAVEEDGGPTSSVFRIDTPDGCSISGTPCQITELSFGSGAIKYPAALETDGDGNLYIVDRGDQNTGGIFKLANPDECATSGPTICSPTKIHSWASGDFHTALADQHGHLFYTNQNANTVYQIAPGGTGPGTLVISSTGDGVNALAGANKLAVNASADLFVTGSGSSNAFRIGFDYEFFDFGDLPAAYSTVTVLSSGDAARHVPQGPYLGLVRDGELDGSLSPDAGFSGMGGDDGDALDDEDGVTASQPDPEGLVFAQFIAGSTAYLGVQLSGASSAYLQVWLDSNGANGFEASERVRTDYFLSSGYNSVPLVIPSALTATAAGLRLRVTSYAHATTPVNVDGLASDGEVEDYVVDIVGSGPVTLIAPTGGGTVEVDGTDLVFSDPDGDEIMRAPVASVTALTIEGNDSDETVTIDEDLLNIAALTLTVKLGEGFDTIVIAPTTNTTGTLTHTFLDANSGSFSVVGGGTVNYTGLDPILDVVTATTRVMTFSAAADVITVSADGDGASGNGSSFIDSNASEEVSFVNPTSELTINTGDGLNTVALGVLDLPLDVGFVGVTVNGGADPDVFTVTPAEYPITINGGLPATGVCPGDALTFDLSGGAVIDTITNVAGSGTVTFQPPYADVTFTSIESIGDADIALTANYEVLYATQDLDGTTALVVTATNDGPYDANCVTVTIDADLSVWLAGSAVAASGGSSYTPFDTWSIPTLVAGESVTLTIEGFVVPPTPQEVTFTSSAAQDPNADNDVLSLELSFGFTMPAKTQVNTALYYERTVSTGDTYEALVAGIWGGAPGITGAVWCKIPSEVGAPVIWPVAPMTPASIGDFWRPCSNGLPFPLHPTDLFLDEDTGRLWLTTWGNAGLYYSDDEGESWTQSNPDPSCVVVYTMTKDFAGVLYISANDGLVFRSLDGGANWQQVGSLPNVGAHTPWSMTAHPTIAGTIYAGTFGDGVFISEDFGFTWTALVDAGTENEDLVDDKGGHIFDLEFSPDGNYLFAATGTGVYRADLTLGATTFIGAWTFLGPEVTLDDASVVRPEARTVAFTPDGVGDEALVVGTWGFGAFVFEEPLDAVPTYAELVLKQGNVSFVAVSPTGTIFLGTEGGEQVVVTATSLGVSTATEPVQQELPDGYVLSQNYPNPFNPVTTIGFALPETGRVTLSVFDGLGREVAVLVDGLIEAGQHEAHFEARDLPTGAYLYRLTTEKGAFSRTLVLMK